MNRSLADLRGTTVQPPSVELLQWCNPTESMQLHRFFIGSTSIFDHTHWAWTDQPFLVLNAGINLVQGFEKYAAITLADQMLGLMPIAIATGTGIVRQQTSENLEAQLSLVAPLPRDMVLRIKAYLGLTMSQTARILNVSRQTLYDWLDEDATQNIQRDRRVRLSQLAALATEWGRMQPIPPGPLLDIEFSGVSLLSLLEEKELDRARIQSLMDRISQLIESREHERGESLAEKLDRLGFPVVPADESTALSDFLR